MNVPEWRCKGWACREVSQLGSDAAQEEACQAVAIDDWQAGRCQPTNEAKANDREVLPQPIPVEAAHSNHRIHHRKNQIDRLETLKGYEVFGK